MYSNPITASFASSRSFRRILPGSAVNNLVGSTPHPMAGTGDFWILAEAGYEDEADFWIDAVGDEETELTGSGNENDIPAAAAGFGDCFWINSQL